MKERGRPFGCYDTVSQQLTKDCEESLSFICLTPRTILHGENKRGRDKVSSEAKHSSQEAGLQDRRLWSVG
jgi:hypothetical protein